MDNIGPKQDDSFVDNRSDYEWTEVTGDYNAGVTSALAGMVDYWGGTPATDCGLNLGWNNPNIKEKDRPVYEPWDCYHSCCTQSTPSNGNVGGSNVVSANRNGEGSNVASANRNGEGSNVASANRNGDRSGVTSANRNGGESNITTADTPTLKSASVYGWSVSLVAVGVAAFTTLLFF